MNTATAEWRSEEHHPTMKNSGLKFDAVSM
jgi:hypothetical protein